MKFTKAEKKQLRAVATQAAILAAVGGSDERVLALADALHGVEEVLRAKVEAEQDEAV